MWLFLAVSWVCLQFVIVVFPDCTHLPFFQFFLLEVGICVSKLKSSTTMTSLIVVSKADNNDIVDTDVSKMHTNRTILLFVEIGK